MLTVKGTKKRLRPGRVAEKHLISKTSNAEGIKIQSGGN